MKVKLSQIEPSPDNAAGRSEMNEEMEELIASIKAQGVVGGISVRPNGKGYEIIDGERRWFAAGKAGNVKEIDVVVHDVTKEQARLMRLASLPHEDWDFEEFANKIADELKIYGTYKELSGKLGISEKKIGDAAKYYAAKNFGAVITIDGEVKIPATTEIWTALHPDKMEKIGPRYRGLVKDVTNKCNKEKIAFNMVVRELVRRIKKALPNEVEIGEKEYNFELESILEIRWDDPARDKKIGSLAKAKEQVKRKEEKERADNDAAVKQFLDAAKAWRKALALIVEDTGKFSPEGKTFTLEWLDDIAKLEDELRGKLK